MGFRINGSDQHPSKNPSDEPLKGVSRLVNPRNDDSEIVSGDEDEEERDYLGRILHVADEALRHVKRGFLRRARRPHLH